MVNTRILATSTIINNRYRIVKLLGQGGYGAVYRAWDLNLNHVCALKENQERSIEAKQQFENEAKTLATLSHPNLPRVTDHFFIQGFGQYLVMDFVDGEDLESLLELRGKIEEKQSIAWICQISNALLYLHSQNPPVIHRDIKPANIRITPEGKAILVDFGLVKLYSPNHQTMVGARGITPGFAPPEQYGKGITDTRTDIYALGATLYAMLTGRTPIESIQRIAGEKLPLVETVNHQISPSVSNSIRIAMELIPINRFQNIGEFKTALTSFTSRHAKPQQVFSQRNNIYTKR